MLFANILNSKTFSQNQKREFLLSVALEYNFNGFLKKCAFAWADGSYLGKDESTGIGLSTLTDWIWNRAREIKEVCNRLCKPLFDYSERRIDYGTQKQLSQCCKQLKVLSELLIVILRDYRHFIPDHIVVQLKTQSETIKMASDYQEVLQWLLNVGLLPEGHYYPDHRDQRLDDEFVIVPYPYQAINSYYQTQRIKLVDEWTSQVLRHQDEESSKFLFIDAFIEHECNSVKLREIWNGVYPPRSIQALLRVLLVPDISVSNKHVIFVYLFMDITNVLSEGEYSSIVRNLIKFPAVFKMNPAMIKRTQAFWNLDNGHLDTAVEELISPLSHDKHLPLWQRELLIGALLKQNANSLALRALRCPGNQISSDLEMLTLLSNSLLSEALKVQRSSGERRLLEKLFEKILHSPNYEQLLDLTLTEDEGSVLGEYLMKLKDTGLPNHLNIHFVFLLQRSKFLDAAQLVESLSNESNMNLEPPKQVLNAYYATMESTTRRLTSMVYKEDVQVQESPTPLSVNLIRSRCNAKNDIYQQCVQSITEAAYESSQDVLKLPFIGSPKLGIFEYKQPTVTYQDLSYSQEVNEHGKRKQVEQEGPIIRLEDLEAPQQKKRKLNESVDGKKRKSYMDMRIANLTVFKETKPNFTFANRNSGGNTPRTTPDRVKSFGNFLNTPVVQRKTPPIKFSDKGPATPHSILKTRSCRGSVSPAPSRFSEFGDDNKSVKSITFAALPDSRDTSFNESSMMEESFNEEPMESSVEKFYSPEKMQVETTSIIEGPKVRKPIKSRSTTPVDRSQSLIQQLSQEILPVPETVEVRGVLKEDEPLLDDLKPSEIVVETPKSDGSSDGTEEYAKPFRERSVLRDDSSFDENVESSDSVGTPDKSIFNYVRKSVLPDNFGEEDSGDSENETRPEAKKSISENSSDSELVDDEQFEEEELPDHSDYDESSNEAFGYENDVNLDDSEDSKSRKSLANVKRKQSSDNEVICLDSSSDEEAIQKPPVTLPSFCVLDTGEIESVPINRDFAELVSCPSSTSVQVISSQEEMLSSLYDDISKSHEEIHEAVEIESPPYEEVLQEPQEVIEDQFLLIEPTSTVAETETNQDVESSSILIGITEEALQAESNEVSFAEEHQELQTVETAENQDNLPSSSTDVPTQEAETVQVQEVLEAPEKPDVSEVSEDFSFASALGGELNEAFAMSPIPVEASNVTVESTNEKTNNNESKITNESVNLLDQAQVVDEASMETAKDSFNEPENLAESDNPLNVGQVIEVIEESREASKEESLVKEETISSPSLSRKRSRARSSSIEPSDRLLRATSMPSNASSSPRSSHSRSRASTEDREATKKSRKVQILERIQENASPGMLTRHRSQLLEIEEKQETPQTPVRPRRLSHLSEGGGGSPQTTPRRLTRAASRESLVASGSEKSPDEPGQLKRQPSKRIVKIRTVSASGDENDDAKSTQSSVRSTRSSSKKNITPTNSAKVTPEKSSPAEELSVSNRRLTRNQLHVLEKSRQLSEKLLAAGPGSLRATKSDVSPRARTRNDDSDNESIKSDSGSVVSSRASKGRKRKSTILHKEEELSIIPEESHEGKA